MTDEVEKTRRELWDERHAAREPIESHEPDEALVGLEETLTPGRALDLAAGDGRNAIWLASRGWAATGVDFSAVGIDRARTAAAKAGVDVAWVHADLLEWRPVEAMADLVTVMFLHLPVDERRSVFDKAALALQPGLPTTTWAAGGSPPTPSWWLADPRLSGYELRRHCPPIALPVAGLRDRPL